MKSHGTPEYTSCIGDILERGYLSKKATDVAKLKGIASTQSKNDLALLDINGFQNMSIERNIRGYIVQFFKLVDQKQKNPELQKSLPFLLSLYSTERLVG